MILVGGRAEQLAQVEEPYEDSDNAYFLSRLFRVSSAPRGVRLDSPLTWSLAQPNAIARASAHEMHGFQPVSECDGYPASLGLGSQGKETYVPRHGWPLRHDGGRERGHRKDPTRRLDAFGHL